jgi:chromosome segregation ATPase
MTREELQDRIAALQAEHDSLVEQEEAFKRKATEIDLRLQSLKGLHNEEQFAGRIAALEEELKQVLKATDDAYARRTQANAELGRLQNLEIELARTYHGTTQKEIQKARAAVDTAQQEVDALQAKIAELSAPDGEQATADLNALRERRKTAAAGVVLGEAADEEVRALDDQIAALEPAAQREATERADRAAAVEVLRQRLPAAEDRLKQAKTALRTKELDYLRGAAEDAAKAYRDAGERLIRAYRRVIAFDWLLSGADLALMMPSVPDLTLPCLRAKAFPEKPDRYGYRSFYSAQADRDGFAQARVDVEAELRAAGVKL